MYAGSSIVTNAPLWWAILITGGAMHIWGGGGIWEISVSSPQFCHVPKTALKIVLIKKIFFNSLLPKAYKEGNCLIFELKEIHFLDFKYKPCVL